jgi:hypothetical protein
MIYLFPLSLSALYSPSLTTHYAIKATVTIGYMNLSASTRPVGLLEVKNTSRKQSNTLLD